MPKLPTYTAPLSGGLPIDPGRRAGGEDFGAQAGAEITRFGGVVADVAEQRMQDMEREDQRKMLVGHAELRAKYAKALQDAELSGGDLDPIRQRFEEEADALRNQTSTEVGAYLADTHTQNSLAVFDTRAAQVKIQRASAEARTAGSKLLANNASLLMTNPAYLPVALAEADAFAATYEGRLRPDQIAEVQRSLRENLTVSAVSGQIMTGDPKAVHDKLVGGEWPEIGPEARTALLGRAITQQRALRSEQESAERYATWKRTEDSRAAKDEYLKEIFAGTFKPTAAVGDTRLVPEHREHLMVFNEQWWRSKQGQEKVSDQRVVRDLMLRAYARDGDPRKIYNDDLAYDALAKGKINVTDFNRLRVAIAEQRDEQNSPVGRQFGRALNVLQKLYSGPLWFGREQVASNIVNSWAWAVQDRMAQLRKENKDPAQLFNPKSPEYVLSPDFLGPLVAEAKDGKPDFAPPTDQEVKFPDGTVRKWSGQGDPADIETWTVVKDTTPAEMLLPTSGVKVRWNGKGDKNDLANWEPTEPFKPSGGDISDATARYRGWRDEAAKQRQDFYNSLFGGE